MAAKFEVQNLTRNCNESLIMAILKPGKKHGYQIALEIEERSDNSFRFNHGTLYPILHKLEKEKLISGTWKQEGPKRKRKYYQLTAKGKRHAAALLSEWHTFFKKFFNIAGDMEK